MIYTKEQTNKINEHNFAYIIVKEDNNILEVTLNRPKQRNALNEVIVRELAFALSYAHYNNDIRVVTLLGNGEIFCAGADLKTLMGYRDTDSGSTIPIEDKRIIIGDLFNGLHKPCIATISKPVYAGGFLLLGGCTHVIAAESSTFTLSEVKRGIWPFQVMASLLKIMPERKVLDWCIQGKTWSAREAYESGLVTHLVADKDLDSTLEEFTYNICNNSPTAIRLGLKAVEDMKEIANKDQHKFLHKRLMELVETEDAQEGMIAFKQKRKPNWTGN
ncbi:MAG: enoyl-CoA hydratase-related protein [Saprospiraceae bacterium]|nr:enoyl-CoA hydratase-related protein [Saprospiraceae bacterium]